MAALDTDVRPGLYETLRHPLEAATSGVAWPAVLGGAFAAVALSVVLLALGSGFGIAVAGRWSFGDDLLDHDGPMAHHHAMAGIRSWRLHIKRRRIVAIHAHA